MDRYVRVKKIGEGSFGKALLVKKKNDGKHYVIKEINISRMKPREREESRKEVKVLSRLKHPNIVTYMESFEETGNLYIVMDYCDGGDLYKKINGQRGILFDEQQVMDWFVQIALGMKHVHDRKILHRDIKSQNIFLTRHGIVKLGDFGIARVLHSTVELARTCIGTPYYLSPEIVENRPYNNKSDIWSLGCVLYEMLTLKHAFEAGNMKNLVLKIIRGSYPPIPIRYSADIRLLVSQLLKRNPRDRPSVNTVLKKNFIQKRIQKFLSEEVIEDEFSHTVLHRKPFGVQGQRPLPPKPAPVKPLAAAPRVSRPEAKYSVSVSVAKKKAPKKPGSGGEVAKKVAKDRDSAKPAGKRKEMDARERRRRELMQNQDQMYNEHMKKVQQQRWERQQRDQINRAREQAWKSTMSVGLSPEKQAANAPKQHVVNKDPQAMNKYQRPISAQERKENIPDVPRPSRPVSAISANKAPPNPTPAWEAAWQGQINREQGAKAAEQARIKEEYWARKREAARNKNRGVADYGGYEYKPPVQPKAVGGNGNGNRNGGMRGRNREEQDYLARLEAIRRQNYGERREIQRRMAGIRGPPQAKPAQKEEVKVPGDPRYDPEARRKKIAALKQQAEERAAMLRRQLDEKKKAVLEKLNKAGKEKWEEEQKKIKEKPSANERPIPMRRAVPEETEKPVAAAVGLETALKQVGVKTLFRSNSENDIAKVCNEIDDSEEQDVNQHPRKKWGAIPFQPRLLPLEVTSSHMEATSAQDAVIKPGDENSPARRQWGQQKTQIVSALGNIKLQTATTTMGGIDQSDAAAVKSTKMFVPCSPSAGIGQTVTIQKQQVAAQGSPIGQTITVSSPSLAGLPVAGSPATPNTVILKKPSQQETIPEDQEEEGPAGVKKAWDEKPTTPPKDSSVPKSPRSPKPDSRQAYDQFVKSVLNEEKKTEETPTKDKESAVAAEDLKVDDVSVEESSFHTADGSPEKSCAVMLKTGNFDTNSKRLRTCSMPDLRLLFTTPGKNPFFEQDEDVPDNDADAELEQDDDVDEGKGEEEEEGEEGEEEEEEKADDENDGDDDDDDDGDDGDDEEGEDEEFCDDEEEELAGTSDEEEEAEEYENMLASMRDVLVSSARSPSPMKAVGTGQSMDWDPTGDTAAPSVDDADGPKDDQNGRSSELSNLNEDWDSGEGEDDGDENVEDEQKEEDDSVFQRLEESRLTLEQELGFDRFLRVYKYLQAVQENEDDSANVGSSEEITELLGDKEHLYPKILYLVIADSAYNEDNQ